jgi:Carboxypeptidase regulatory-like domain
VGKESRRDADATVLGESRRGGFFVRILGKFILGTFCAGLGAGGVVCADRRPKLPTSVAAGGQAQAETSAGSVTGRVVLEGIGAGIRKVIVQLQGTTGETRQQYMTATDTEGRFRIEGVAAGEYSVTLSRAGFVLADAKQDLPPVTVSAGQELSGLVYKMQLTGVIAGKITEADGDPLQGASVWVTRVGKNGTEFDVNTYDEGAAGVDTTNDLGEFRIANLRAGQYIVKAQARGMGPAPDPADKGKQKERSIYALTYYPGTLEAKTANPVRVTAGGTAPASFGVVTSRSYRVSGTVTVAGNPRNVQMFLVSTTGQTEAQSLQEAGKFEFASVLPGTYVAQIVDMSSGTPGGPAETHTQMIGSPIVVTNADVTGLVLQPEAGGSVSGKLRAEGEETLDWRDLNVILVRVVDAEELPQLSDIGALGGTTRVKEDGSFVLKDVAGATYWVYLNGQAEKLRDYYLKSVLQDGREVADTGFAVSGETTIDIVVSAKGAAVEGTVVDSDGQGAAAVSVVSLPASGKVGRMDLYQTEKTDASGHFLMRGMNPGAYVLVAVESVPGDVRRPEFFQKYAEKGATVDLLEGDKKSVVVQLVVEGGE